VPHEVFVDSGAWIAIAVRGDAHHQVAVNQYRALLAESRLLVTTNLVIAESYILIRRAGGHRSAIQVLQALRATPRLFRVYSTAEIEEAAEQILIRYVDQDFSFVDSVSFAVMRARHIDESFAFDRHFLAAGFTPLPGEK
jgi:predicted nucleic acid-binding protein